LQEPDLHKNATTLKHPPRAQLLFLSGFARSHKVKAVHLRFDLQKFDYLTKPCERRIICRASLLKRVIKTAAARNRLYTFC